MKLFTKLASRGLMLLGGLLIPVLILEALVRLLGLAPPHVPLAAIWTGHPLYGWFHQPNAGGLIYNDFNEFQVEIHINPRGLRDRDIGYDNPDGKFRILVLADSYGEAIQVPLEEAYSKQLETRLNVSGDGAYEVINAGVGGWGTDQEAVFYATEGFRYQPNLVLLSFFTRNDVVNNSETLELRRIAGSRQKPFFHLGQNGELILPNFPFEPPPTEAPPRPALLPVAEWLAPRSALYRFVAPYLRDIPPLLHAWGASGILGGEGIVRAAHPDTPVPFYVYQDPLEPEWEAAWALTEALIRRLRQEVEEDGGQLAVVIIAAPEQVYPERWDRTLASNSSLQLSAWDLELPNKQLAAFLDKEGIPYVDLLPFFRDAAAQPNAPRLHLQHDGHWTAEGHALAAEVIYRFLVNNDLVPVS